jgi:chromosome segregation ATPase
MAIKFASILKVLGMGSTSEAVTEAHLEAADAKIEQLEADKAAADLKAEQTAAALKTAQEEKTKITGELKTASDKVATLEEWKKNQAQVDNRDEDDSNSLEDNREAKASWEVEASAAVNSVKRRLGVN